MKDKQRNHTAWGSERRKTRKSDESILGRHDKGVDVDIDVGVEQRVGRCCVGSRWKKKGEGVSRSLFSKAQESYHVTFLD